MMKPHFLGYFEMLGILTNEGSIVFIVFICHVNIVNLLWFSSLHVTMNKRYSTRMQCYNTLLQIVNLKYAS